MSDSQYNDKELVALYDILNAGTDDHNFYLQLPETDGLRILDIGCGTGVLAVEFAKDGHMVTGVDPALAMIEFAKKRQGGGSVDWHCSSISEFTSSTRFDLITMTGHAFQCLHEDAEILQLFSLIRRLLGDNGRFVFETRNPAFGEWSGWNPEDSRVKSISVTGEPFEVYHEVVSVSDQFVEFNTTHKPGGSRKNKVCYSKLRFIPIEDLTNLISAADLAVSEVYGDWDKSILTDSSPEIICSLQKITR